MNVRTGFVTFGILSLGSLSAACSVAAGPPTAPGSAPAHPPSTAGPAEPTTSSVSWLKISPEQGTPGSMVSLNVACLDNLGPVSSPVLNIGPLKGNPEGHQPWNLFSAGTVHSDAAPGSYRVSAPCGDGELSVAFTVVPGPSR